MYCKKMKRGSKYKSTSKRVRDVEDDTSEELQKLHLKPSEETCCFSNIFANCKFVGGSHCYTHYEELVNKVMTMLSVGITVTDSDGQSSDYELLDGNFLFKHINSKLEFLKDRKGRLITKNWPEELPNRGQGLIQLIFESQDEDVPMDFFQVTGLWDKELVVELETSNFRFANSKDNVNYRPKQRRDPESEREEETKDDSEEESNQSDSSDEPVKRKNIKKPSAKPKSWKQKDKLNCHVVIGTFSIPQRSAFQ